MAASSGDELSRGSYLEGLRKVTMHLNQDSPFIGLNSNQSPSECKSKEELLLWPTYIVISVALAGWFL